MNFRLLPMEEDGASRKFEQVVDLSYIKHWGNHPFQRPALVTGTLTELDYGLYNLTYQVNYTSVLPCARCLTTVEREFLPSLTHKLGEGAQHPLTEEMADDLALGRLHLTGLVGADLLEALEDQVLCTEDCKGLCPLCGENNNTGHCDCKQEQVRDPRFDVLRELLGK